MAPHSIPEIVRQNLLHMHSAQPVELIRGGLSGAVVFRCTTPSGIACLRRWPKSHPTQPVLRTIHQALHLAHQAGMNLVPRLLPARDGLTYFNDGQQFWELTDWKYGTADYLEHPSETRLQAAMQALAKLHQTWQSHGHTATSPAAELRRNLLANLLAADLDQLWSRPCRNAAELSLVQATRAQLRRHGPSLLESLRGLSAQPMHLQFAIRDIWSDHVLFTGDEVTGIIDFGALRIDEPATDVARLLGSLEPLSLENWEKGLQFYLAAGAPVDSQRVAILDHASCLLAAAQWAKWLIVERRTFAPPEPVLQARWSGFLERLQRRQWPAI